MLYEDWLELLEKKSRIGYSDLNTTSKIKSVDDLKRAAHNQGYEASVRRHPTVGSHSIVDVKHRKTGEPVKKPGGQEIGGKNPKGGKITDTTVINTMSQAIRSDRKRRGGTDKTPEGKAKTKAKMKADLEAKRKKAHGGLTMLKPQKKRTFESFMSFCVNTLTDPAE